MNRPRANTIRRGMAAVMILVLCFLTGCSGADASRKQYSLERRLAVYSLLFSGTKDEVLEKLGLSADEVTETQQSTFRLPQQEYIGEYAFDVELCFERNSGAFYGFIYTAEFADLDEALAEYDALITSFRKKWGEPATYPDIGNRYLDARDPKPKIEKAGSVLEYWNMPAAALEAVPEDTTCSLSARLARSTVPGAYTIRIEITWSR